MATSTTTDKVKRLNGLAIAARADAVQALIEKYPEEFGTLLREKREARGLTAESGGESTKKLQERLEKALERAEKARELLAQRGVKVET